MYMPNDPFRRPMGMYTDKLWRGRREYYLHRKKDFQIRKLEEYLIIFLYGAFAYMSIEVAFRGRTHWSMGILGGIALLLIGLFNEGLLPVRWGLIPQGIVGSLVITGMELVTGVICNLWLGWEIWDYSNMPMNFLGQICLPFSLIWVILSIVAIYLDDGLRYFFFNEEVPHYDIWYCKHHYE